MSNSKNDIFDKEFVQWLSTYGFVTVQRVLGLMNLSIDFSELKDILRDKNSAYYHFLRVPLANIFNNIIINQAEGYREYIQKIFIDYLLSGSANEAGASLQGESTRDDLEEIRVAFMKLADDFDIECFNHNSLIADSQTTLAKLAKTKFKNISAIEEDDINELLKVVGEFEEKARQLTSKFREFRSKFQDIIINTQRLVSTLPGYHFDEKQNETYKESINFDTNIGGQIH